MAGDWIAWVKGLTKRREVLVMAAALDLSPREVAAFCMEWWEWCDAEADFDRSRNCHVRGVSFEAGLALIDTHVGCAGFARQLAAVSWAVSNKKGELMHPGLGRWTGSTARERLQGNRRKTKSRAVTEMSRKCHGKNVTKPSTREEKRREEKKEIDPTDLLTPLPPSIDTPEVRDAWLAFVQHRKEKRATLTPTAESRALAKLEGLGPARALAALEHSTSQGYTGIFEPGTSRRGSPRVGPGQRHPDEGDEF